MKINSAYKPNRKLNIIALILVLALGASGAVYAHNAAQSQDASDAQESSNISPESINYDEATTDQKNAGTEQKKQTTDTTQDEDETATLSVLFTSATPMVLGDTLRVRIQIDAVTNTGECTLNLTNGDMVVVKKSAIQAGPNISTCQGFDVLTSELANGQWRAEITVVSEGRTGKATQAFAI